jgi:hypothetical protein
MHTPAAALCYLYLECAAVFLIRSWDRPLSLPRQGGFFKDHYLCDVLQTLLLRMEQSTHSSKSLGGRKEEARWR